jgi:single-stranded DNA-binding protein
MSTNVVILTGRTAREPKIEENKNGGKTVLMTIAVNRGKNSKGEQMVDYINTKAFIAKDAKSNGPYDYIGKGQLITVEAQLRSGSYEKDGKTVYTTDVVINNGGVSLLERSRVAKGDAEGAHEEEPVVDADAIGEEDLPF